jgi:hypothetical protein
LAAKYLPANFFYYLPIITEIPFDYSTLSLSEEDEFRTRSPGLHLTDITKDMLTVARLGFKEDPGADPNKRKMQFEKGFLWERLIQHILQAQEVKAGILSGRLVRTGEYVYENVIATPDAVDMVALHLEEWKATAISPKNLNKDTLRYKKPEWLWAAAWHLHYFGMDSVIYRIWHHREFEPTIQQLRVTFTPEEKLDNHDRIINHAKAKGML